jgi:hypothetical protein
MLMARALFEDRRTMTLHLPGRHFSFARHKAVAGGPAGERSRSATGAGTTEKVI